MENFQAELNNFRDSSERLIQTMEFFNEEGSHSRDAYFDLNDAVQFVEDTFVYEDGKRYLVKYLTSYGWKSGKVFRYQEGITNFDEVVFSEDTEKANYNTQALEGNQIHVYAIQVRQMSL